MSKIKPGMQITVKWRSRPVWILHRTPQMLERLQQPAHLKRLRDPDSKVASQQPAFAVNAFRSIKPEWFIVYALH